MSGWCPQLDALSGPESDPPEAKLGSLGQQPGLLEGEASSLLG